MFVCRTVLVYGLWFIFFMFVCNSSLCRDIHLCASRWLLYFVCVENYSCVAHSTPIPFSVIRSLLLYLFSALWNAFFLHQQNNPFFLFYFLYSFSSESAFFFTKKIFFFFVLCSSSAEYLLTPFLYFFFSAEISLFFPC